MLTRSRLLLRILPAAAVMVAAALAAVILWPSSDAGDERREPATTTTTSGPARAEPRTLVDYLRQPGDQAIVVPDGTYTGGLVEAHHAATDGRYQGWLILVAETRGGVVVDLSDEELVLQEGSSRVAFVGFTFRNGRVRNHGNQIRYWYTTHTFPYDDWVEAGGPSGPNPRPKTMVIGDAKKVEIYGADFTDIGDDGINLFNARDVHIAGTVFDGITNDGHGDLIHADAIQVQGDVRRMTIRQSVLERQHIGTEGKGDVAKLVWEDCWFRGSRSAGITFAVDKGLRVTGERARIRSWGHGNDTDRIDVVDGDRRRPGSSRRIDVDDTDIVTRRPPAGTPSPAEEWRAAHPYDSWSSLFD